MENLKQQCTNLAEFDWTFKRVHTTEEVDSFLSQPAGSQLIDNSNMIVLLTGTNHIRKNEDIDTIFKKIKNIIEKIPENMPKIILEIPPWKNDKERTFNSKLLNITLQSLEKTTQNTKVCKYRSTLDKMNTAETMFDDSHINRTITADIIITELKNDITSTEFSTAPAPGKQISIPAEKAGRIIGKFQTNLKHWAKNHSVTINLNKGDTPSLTVIGNIDNIRKVEEEVKKIINITETNKQEGHQTREKQLHSFPTQHTTHQRNTTVSNNYEGHQTRERESQNYATQHTSRQRQTRNEDHIEHTHEHYNEWTQQRPDKKHQSHHRSRSPMKDRNSSDSWGAPSQNNRRHYSKH